MPRGLSRSPICLCLLTGGLLVALIEPSQADPGRRSARRSQPASTAHAAPDVTGTIAKGPAPKTPAVTRSTMQDDETLPPPFNLPSAPRARMRACGEQWQEIKLSGKAADQTWREFATRCLAEVTTPIATRR